MHASVGRGTVRIGNALLRHALREADDQDVRREGHERNVQVRRIVRTVRPTRKGNTGRLDSLRTAPPRNSAQIPLTATARARRRRPTNEPWGSRQLCRASGNHVATGARGSFGYSLRAKAHGNDRPGTRRCCAAMHERRLRAGGLRGLVGGAFSIITWREEGLGDRRRIGRVELAPPVLRASTPTSTGAQQRNRSRLRATSECDRKPNLAAAERKEQKAKLVS